MNVRPIAGTLPGEHVLAVEPRPAFPSVDAGWTRRLRLFQGRALDAVALTTEQDARASKLAVLGQTRASGIISGLEVSLEHGPDTQLFLHVSPGMGLLPSGEDVVLGHELRLPPSALGTIDGALRAAILIAVPVTTRIAGRFDPEDPCEVDPSEEAFADEQRVDAMQLELLPWDTAWAALDATSAQRNQLAYTIRARARAAVRRDRAVAAPRPAARARRPERRGDRGLDRHAVARRGGDPLVRSPLVAPGARVPGTPALWQARILQLADHLADLRTAGGLLPSVQAAQLALLPPAGVIPKDARAAHPTADERVLPAGMAAARDRPAAGAARRRARARGPRSRRCRPRSPRKSCCSSPVPEAVHEPHLLETELVARSSRPRSTSS